MNTKDLCCIYCHKEPEHGDIFISKTDDNGIVEGSECLRCGEMNLNPNKAPTGGYVVLKREYDSFFMEMGDGTWEEIHFIEKP